mmetsp:Transcript_26333/g.66839  ORF Transcript_26333/g.66839 Transcript_26333/m.66839 type:complete len:168 (-) Transcript_26333:224-727(-)
METQPMGADDGEVRECIRRLVAVIRRSSTGGSPVDGEQLEHIQKVIRVLSLSEEQVSSMRIEERAQVLKIRSNALQKMRLANNLRASANSSDGGSSNCSSPTLGPSSPLSASPPGASSYGSSPLSCRASSAPTAIPTPMAISVSPLPDHLSMPPPAFYVRRERVSET